MYNLFIEKTTVSNLDSLQITHIWHMCIPASGCWL